MLKSESQFIECHVTHKAGAGTYTSRRHVTVEPVLRNFGLLGDPPHSAWSHWAAAEAAFGISFVASRSFLRFSLKASSRTRDENQFLVVFFKT